MDTKLLDAEISRKLARQFGSKFIKILEDSPTLRRDLRKLHLLGARIQRWNGRDGAYCRSEPSHRRGTFIAIGSLCSPIMKAIYLAHEAYHALYGTTPNNPNPTKISRKRYLSMGIAEETRAFLHQTKVANELWNSGNHVIPAWQLHLMLLYHTSGYTDMREHVLACRESIAFGTYEQNYGKIWDQAYRQFERERREKLAARRLRSLKSRYRLKQAA